MSPANISQAPAEYSERTQLIRAVRSMAASRWASQAIYVAAELGVADALADGSQPADGIAEAVGADPAALRRLMRALVTLGLVIQTDDVGFALTPLGTVLRSDAPDSVRNSVSLTLGPGSWRAWGELVNCVRTGDTAAKILEGLDDPFSVFDTSEAVAVFNRAMAEGTRRIADAVALAYDFAGVRRLVDVGGGYGALLSPILRAHPEMTAVVFDLARCADGATHAFREMGLADRSSFVAGDFFHDALPGGADVYTLKSVIHDWDDDRSLSILRSCRAAATASTRLLIIEVVMPARLDTSPDNQAIVSADLNMLVSTGGRERTDVEYQQLLARASFEVSRIVPTLSGFSVIEGKPV